MRRFRFNMTFSLLAATLALGPSLSAQTPPTPQASARPDLASTSSDAPIGARDVLDIKVFEDPALNTRATVSDDGKITMPLIGKVDVSGLTPVEVENKIKGLLEARYINKAQVSVQVLEAGSKPISVIGAVMRPGRIGATGNLNLIQAITQAGGLAPGYGRTLYILRSGASGLSDQLAVDIDELMVRGNADLNVPLRANDVINIPVESVLTVYVLGEVMHPGKVQFRSSQQHPTLLQALADAGGLTDRASRTVVLKRWVNGAEKTIEMNFKRIIAGKQSDLPLLDNDTIVVKESIF
jgi:Periplasmic protein involved in polysaccharide export